MEWKCCMQYAWALVSLFTRDMVALSCPAECWVRMEICSREKFFSRACTAECRIEWGV